MKRVQIRMRTSQDTLRKCEELDQDWGLYFGGYTRPHFQVPAIPVGIAYNKDCLIMVHNRGFRIISRSAR